MRNKYLTPAVVVIGILLIFIGNTIRFQGNKAGDIYGYIGFAIIAFAMGYLVWRDRPRKA